MSADRFHDEIVEGGACFICGVKPGTKVFNKEHVLPKWILKRHNLFERMINLPAGLEHKYGTYRIPCCQECNSLLGVTFENPLKKPLSGGYESVAAFMREGGGPTIFMWLALIFLKSHLKDKSIWINPDRRSGGQRVGDMHPWQDLHHIHCLIRAVHTDASISPEAFGSMVLLPAEIEPGVEPFDLIDLTEQQTLVMRLDDFALAAVFNDSGAVQLGTRKILERVSAPLKALQVREIAAHFAACNDHLENRPQFRTKVDPNEEPYVFIEGAHGESPRFRKPDPKVFGRILQHLIAELNVTVSVPGIEMEALPGAIGSGSVSFL